MELYRQQIEELESHLSAATLEAGVSSQCELCCHGEDWVGLP